MSFRFRAGEEDLEELAVPESPPAEQPQFEALHKMFQQLPKKLLHKDPSVSDSEDTSESSKISEWWKENEESRHPRSGSSLSLPESTESPKKKSESVHDIKIAKGRVDKNQQPDDVEPAEEVDEDLTPDGPPTSQQNSSQGSQPLTPISSASCPMASPNCPQEAQPADRLRLLSLASPLIGWCLPILAVMVTTDSSFWHGAVVGICVWASLKTLWKIILEVWFPSHHEVTPFQVPVSSALRAKAEPPHKRGCFNVYSKPYDPGTYSVSQTRPVCLELKGHMLRVTRVKTKMAKRAHFNETDFEIDNSRYAYYDMSRCSVLLLPHGLTRKRLFSKKYPITVLLGDGAVVLAHGDEPFHAGAQVNGHSPAPDSEDENTLSRASLESDSVAVPVTPSLYFFARCDRDKEDWYRRLLKASTPTDAISEALNNQMNNSLSSDVDESPKEPILSPLDDYLHVMSRFLDVPNGLQNKKSLDGEAELEMDVDSLDLQWLNVVMNRLLFDVCRSQYWTQTIQNKLQRKLSSLQLPYYVEEMQISELDLGRTGPVIHSVSRPRLDERGVWMDLDITHPGTIRLTIRTKLNLHKLQKGREEDSLDISAEERMRSRLYDSDAEDSAESSSDEESRSDSPPVSNELDTPTKSKKKAKFLRIVENVAQSRAFRHVANTKVGQNIIAGVSNTDLKLKLEVKGIQGTLAVNIPPPPSDRLWYGFRGMPKVGLTATPQFGSVTSSHVKNWIEKKLIQEFQERYVFPQMGKILLPQAPQPDRISVASSMPLAHDDYPSLESLLEAELEAKLIEEINQQIETSGKIESDENAPEERGPFDWVLKRNSCGRETFDVQASSTNEDRLSRESYARRDSREIEEESCECDECCGIEDATESCCYFRRSSSGKGTYRVIQEDADEPSL